MSNQNHNQVSPAYAATLNVLSKKDGEIKTKSVLNKRLSNAGYSKDDRAAALAELLDDGLVLDVSNKVPMSGNKATLYVITDDGKDILSKISSGKIGIISTLD